MTIAPGAIPPPPIKPLTQRLIDYALFGGLLERFLKGRTLPSLAKKKAGQPDPEPVPVA